MLYLRGRKVKLLWILAIGFSPLLYSSLNAQINQSHNFKQFEKRPYYFGISLGYSSSNFKISHSTDFIRDETYRITEAINGPGFHIGVVGNLKFGEYFDFRMVPTFLFTERIIEYTPTENGSDQHQESLESVFFEVPLLIRYKSAPYNDIRFFVLGGVKYSYDLQNNSRTRQADELIKISPHDYQVEVGFGVQIFLPYFILSPQITFAHGLSNILIANKELKEASVLEKILSRTISFSILFEG